jgi:hypothetical protein
VLEETERFTLSHEFALGGHVPVLSVSHHEPVRQLMPTGGDPFFFSTSFFWYSKKNTWLQQVTNHV